MHSDIKLNLQIKETNCFHCKHHTNENGYDQCMIYQPKSNLKSFPFKKDQPCWEAYFWDTILALDLTKSKYWNMAVYYKFEQLSGTTLGENSEPIKLDMISGFLYNFMNFKDWIKRRCTLFVFPFF